MNYLFLILMAIITIEKSKQLETNEQLFKDLDKVKTEILEFKEILKPSLGNEKFLQYANHTDGYVCKTCLGIIGSVNFVLSKYKEVGTLQVFSFICREFFGFTYDACDGLINKFLPIIADSLLDHYLTAEYICTVVHACEYDHFIYMDPDDYAKDLLKDKPANITNTVIKSEKKLHVLQITDIHTDLLYKEGSDAQCSDANCCRSGSDKEIPEDRKAGKWGYVGKCDLPLRTLENFVDQAVYEQKPDFIIWTGDNPSHSVWDPNNQQEIFNITTIFTEKLMKSNIPVYPCLGNHEKYPADQFYPYEDRDPEERPILAFFADLWRPWLGEEAYQEFKKYGFYSKRHLDTNLRIISYNCLYCDVLNFYLIRDPTDPSGQIKWLEDTLRQSEKNGEVVYIVGHIPIGDLTILSSCSKRLKAIVDRFSHIIKGIFSGHTHLDEIKIISEYYDKTKVAGISFIAPSLTT
jgi:sphingomyelin phosphodiesterase